MAGMASPPNLFFFFPGEVEKENGRPASWDVYLGNPKTPPALFGLPSPVNFNPTRHNV